MSNTIKRRRPGPPITTGKSPIVGVRFPKPELAQLDRLAKAKGCTRSTAIRELVRIYCREAAE
jgi:metal-responsive CopG/Arc/MetJ family transcriptional regulator